MDLEVIEGVRALALYYIDAVNQFDLERFGECFAEDGIWDVGGHFRVEGRDAIKAKFLEQHDQFKWVFQVPHSTQVISGLADSASARTYFSVVGAREDGGFRTFAVYSDQCTRTTGVWQFTLRRFDGLYIGPPDFSAPPTNYPAPRHL